MPYPHHGYASGNFLHLAVEITFPRLILFIFAKHMEDRNILADLGINVPFIKGESIPIRNCWHFSSDGNALDTMFYDDADFSDGMNRIAVTARGFKVTIIAFVLMDTHFHFVLHGPFDECNKFVHEYARRTSISLARHHGERNKMDGVPIHHQVVDDDRYLKNVICYVMKNPTAAGMAYLPWDYPWSSAPLYFRTREHWSSPIWTDDNSLERFPEGYDARRELVFGDTSAFQGSKLAGRIIFPGEYVPVQLVEKIFRTPKSFLYFLAASKDTDVESREGRISYLSIPMQEMRMNRISVSQELFGQPNLKKLDTGQRIRLAKTLRSRYNSSVKQIARLCGLVYSEIVGLL